MWMPTPAQVSAAARHAATLAGGVILAFGLQSKMDPDTVKHLIEQTGNVVNSIILLVGIIIPIITAKSASNSASPTAQIQSVQAMANDPAQPQAFAAKAALLDAATSIPEVIEPVVVTDPKLAAATTSDLVKAA